MRETSQAGPETAGLVGSCGCSVVGPHQGQISEQGTPGVGVCGWLQNCVLVPPSPRSVQSPRLEGLGLVPGPVQRSDRTPWVPLIAPTSAAEDAKVTSRILRSTHFLNTLGLGTAPFPPLSQLDCRRRLGCRELENPRPQSRAASGFLYSAVPISVPSGLVFALAGCRETAVFVMITGQAPSVVA